MWTYFIRGPEGIKIGKSKAPEERRTQLQLAHATELEILVAVPESVITEAAAHEKFHSLRLSGEWFRGAQELMDFIESLKGPNELKPLAPVELPPREQVTGSLAILRTKLGPDTPAGHRCSNIMEMLDTGTAKPADIARQVRELAELTS